MRLRILVLLAVLTPAARADQGDVSVPGESRPSASRLEEIQKTIAAKKFDDAVTALAGVIESNTDLMPLDGGRYSATRWQAQRMLARLPREVLGGYQKRAEPAAKLLFQKAAADGDATALLRVVEDAFCTRSAALALDRLGDLAFARGEFGQAEMYWRMLSPLDRDTEEPAHPDPPEGAAARTEAKQLLARAFAGRDIGADLAAFAKAHPDAKGDLAGKNGSYKDIVAKVSEGLASSAAQAGGDWPTFGGCSGRGAVVPAGEKLLDRLSGLARGEPWRFDIQARKRAKGDLDPPQMKPVQLARRMAYFPAVTGDVAVLADDRYVTAYDLRTGKATKLFDLNDEIQGGKDVAQGTTAIADARLTVTVADDTVYARLGCPSVRDVRPDPKTKEIPDGAESALVAVSLTGKKRWMAKAIDTAKKEYAVFEGAPVAGEGRVWAAATRFEGEKVITAVHCYASDPDTTSPAPVWRTDVCQTRELPPAGVEDAHGRRFRLHLLTLAGPRVVYCSHSGVIAALDANTGRRAWALRYKRRDLREPEDAPKLRDLCPPVFADGRVYVAPADAESVFCLDAMSGEIVWQREKLEVVHLLGVGKGRLIFTTYKTPAEGNLEAGGLRAVMAADGSDKGGWLLPDVGGGLMPMGRGLLAGDLVLWPTARDTCGVIAVRQEDGLQPDNPSLLHRIPSGNLVYANGNLLVCDLRTMWAFVPPEKLPDEDDKVKLESPRVLLREARKAAGRGEREKAIERYEAVALDEARVERQVVLLDTAREVARRKEPKEAEKWLALAAKGPSKLRADIAAAELWAEAGDADRAATARRGLLRTRGLVEEGGMPRRVALVAARRLGQKAAPPVEAKAEGAVSVVLPLRGARSLTLPTDERFVASVGGSLYSHSTKGELIRRRRDGEAAWRAPLAFAPAWLGAAGPLVIAAGDEGIAAFDAEKGERRWDFPAPSERLYPRTRSTSLHVPREVRPGGALSRFLLSGSTLAFVQGGHTLYGLSLAEGEVLWKHRPIDAGLGLPAPFGMVHHVAAVGGGKLLAQVSGRRWLIESSTGMMVEQQRGETTPWPRPPLALPDGGALLVTSAGVERLAPKSLKPAWTFRPPGKSVRAGPPIVVTGGDDVIVVAPENIGLRLIRLDAKTGKPMWNRLVTGDPVALAEHAWATDGERLLNAEVSSLRAWGLKDGKPARSRSLPGKRPWRLMLSGKTLLAWPARAEALAFRWRTADRALQWDLGPLPEGDGLPLLCMDATDGELIQRINLPCETPSLWVRAAARKRGLFPSFEAGVAADAVPVVRTDRAGLVFAIGRSVRVLDNDGPSAPK